MTRGTLFYYESDDKAWSSTEFNGDMYHGTPENPRGEGDKVIKLMQGLKSVDDFKKVLVKINEDYKYDEGYDCYAVGTDGIKDYIESQIKWIDNERPDLKGNTNFDPRTWKKTPSVRDARTWQFWGVPNMSDYSYIYNNSGKDLTIMTNSKPSKMVIPDGALGVLNFGAKDCLCKNGKIIDGMGNYKELAQSEPLSKQEFYQYVIHNYKLDRNAKLLVLSILDYIESKPISESEKHDELTELLHVVGITSEEVSRVVI